MAERSAGSSPDACVRVTLMVSALDDHHVCARITVCGCIALHSPPSSSIDPHAFMFILCASVHVQNILLFCFLCYSPSSGLCGVKLRDEISGFSP